MNSVLQKDSKDIRRERQEPRLVIYLATDLQQGQQGSGVFPKAEGAEFGDEGPAEYMFIDSVAQFRWEKQQWRNLLIAVGTTS